jgi:hypothetical protein
LDMTIEVEQETWNLLAREGKKERLNVEEYLEKVVKTVREDTPRRTLEQRMPSGGKVVPVP